jgi:hypothetical protein
MHIAGRDTAVTLPESDWSTIGASAELLDRESAEDIAFERGSPGPPFRFRYRDVSSDSKDKHSSRDAHNASTQPRNTTDESQASASKSPAFRPAPILGLIWSSSSDPTHPQDTGSCVGVPSLTQHPAAELHHADALDRTPSCQEWATPSGNTQKPSSSPSIASLSAASSIHSSEDPPTPLEQDFKAGMNNDEEVGAFSPGKVTVVVIDEQAAFIDELDIPEVCSPAIP